MEIETGIFLQTKSLSKKKKNGKILESADCCQMNSKTRTQTYSPFSRSCDWIHTFAAGTGSDFPSSLTDGWCFCTHHINTTETFTFKSHWHSPLHTALRRKIKDSNNFWKQMIESHFVNTNVNKCEFYSLFIDADAITHTCLHWVPFMYNGMDVVLYRLYMQSFVGNTITCCVCINAVWIILRTPSRKNTYSQFYFLLINWN